MKAQTHLNMGSLQLYPTGDAPTDAISTSRATIALITNLSATGSDAEQQNP